MSTDFQTIATVVIVAGTALLFLRGALRKRRNPGCGSDCGCPSEQLKAKLKR